MRARSRSIQSRFSAQQRAEWKKELVVVAVVEVNITSCTYVLFIVCFLWTNFVLFRFIIISLSHEHRCRVLMYVCARAFAITFCRLFFYSTFQFDCFIRTFSLSLIPYAIVLRITYLFSRFYSYGLHHFPGVSPVAYANHIQIMSTNRINDKMINGFWYMLSFSVLIYINDMAKPLWFHQ